jgi:17beta-estradiol 17-dehydrogenase / very-long-chain 3-oxoacyl-CoA reductase
MAVRVAMWIRIAFFVKCNLLARYSKGGVVPWAVVTGSSDGIGRSLALQIAKRGLNVVLVSRTKSKLDDIAKEIETKYHVETRVVPFDFAAATKADYDTLIKKDIGSLDVALLVNNVGVATDMPTCFDENPNEENARLVKVNIEASNVLTSALLPQLKKRGSGGIINLSSLTGYTPTPLLCVYAATKAYNRIFSLSLQGEVAEFGIDVLAVTPGVVTTNMSKIRRTSFSDVAPDPMASQVLNKLSYTVETHGHWHHDVVGYMGSFMPTSQILKIMKGVRVKALAKAKKGQ